MKSISLILILCSSFLFAQNKILRPVGSSGQQNEIMKIKTMVNSDHGFKKIIPYDNSLTGLVGVTDTLRYAAHSEYNTNFGFFGQDVLVQWFEAPADMEINAVSLLCTDDEQSFGTVKLVKVSWDKDQIQETQNIGATWWGYYDADQNGYNNIAPFQDNLDVTGGWIEPGPVAQQKEWGSPFGEDLWVETGISPGGTFIKDQETWVSMSLEGYSPQLLAGELFGVVVKNEGTTMDEGRLGFAASNSLGITGFKFYRNGRLESGVDFGWWTRLYSWDFTVAVNLTGDRAPKIELHYPVIPTTLSTLPRNIFATITDDNPSGGAAGVASAQINVQLNSDTTLIVIPMVLTSGDSLNGDWEGQIPGYPAISEITWFVSATDVNGNSSETKKSTYWVFKQKFRTLVVFNGLPVTGYPSDFYFGHDDFENQTTFPFDHDVWAYGALTSELVAYYNRIIEITTFGPVTINSDVIREWIEGDWNRHYMLAGG